MNRTTVVMEKTTEEVVRPDWSAMTHGERGVVVEHALARLRGQAEPPVNANGQRITTPEWDALSPAAREVFIEAAIAEMQRAGAVRDVLSAEVKAELSKPGAEGVVAVVNSAKNVVQWYLVPRPYYEARNNAREEN